MSSTEEQHEEDFKLAPPSTEKRKVEDKLRILLELLWFQVLIVPHILWALYRKIFPTEKSLKGHVALVTGAGRGLGQGLALALAKEGCSLAVVDINIADAEDTAKKIQDEGGKAKAYYANVAKPEHISALRDAVTKDFGPVYLLVNNAGLIYGGELVEDCTEYLVNSVIQVNLISHFWMAKEFLPVMKEHNSGHIVAIASMGAFACLKKCSTYVASKFGLRGFMEVLRADLEERRDNQIKTTIVFPFFINTSADYVNRWETRLPELSISDVVKATVSAIKRDSATVTVPETYYYLCHLVWLLPQTLYDRFVRITRMRVHDMGVMKDTLVKLYKQHDI